MDPKAWCRKRYAILEERQQAIVEWESSPQGGEPERQLLLELDRLERFLT